MFFSLSTRFSRNNVTSSMASTDDVDVTAARFDVVEYGRTLASFHIEADAVAAARFHYVGAHVIDNGMAVR